MLVHGEKSDRIEVDRELVIGREPTSTCGLNNPAVSAPRQGAPLEGGGCIVTICNRTRGPS